MSVAEETGLKLALSDTPKTGFLATRPKLETHKAAFATVTTIVVDAVFLIVGSWCNCFDS